MRHSTSALILCIAVPASVHAIVTSDGPGTHIVSQMDDPFGLKLGGVVALGGFYEGEAKGFCTGTLITDRRVLTAAHCFDNDGDLQIDPDSFLWPSDVLLEIEGNWITVDYDPAKAKWSEEWETSRADIAIVTLEADAPAGVPKYPLYGGSSEVGQPFVLVGYGRTGFGPTGVDYNLGAIPQKRAGQNQYDALALVEGAPFLVSDFDSGQAEHNSLGDLGFGADEVGTAEHDSGGPGFLDGAVASVVAFGNRFPLVDATTEHDSSWGERDFGTRVSHYQDFIMSATDGQAVFVFPGEVSILGDFDNDQLLTAADADILSRATRFGIDHYSFDLNGDGAVDQLDREKWVHDLVGTFFGDTNLDRAVEFADFLALSGSFDKQGDWANGDSDGNGLVQFADFLILSENFGQSANELATVPEPSFSFVLVSVALAILLSMQPCLNRSSNLRGCFNLLTRHKLVLVRQV